MLDIVLTERHFKMKQEHLYNVTLPSSGGCSRHRDRARARFVRFLVALNLIPREWNCSDFNAELKPHNLETASVETQKYIGLCQTCNSSQVHIVGEAQTTRRERGTAATGPNHEPTASAASTANSSSAAFTKETTAAGSISTSATSIQASPKRSIDSKFEAMGTQVINGLQAVTSKDDPQVFFERILWIGEGGFATVYGAKCKKPMGAKHPHVALKCYDLQSNAVNPCLVEEINIMGTLRHPNIPRFLGAYLPDDKELTIAMELAAGPTLTKILRFSRMNEQQLATMCRELCSCLDYLHSKLIIHGDIKSSNIILTCSGEVNLFDFEASTKLTSRTSKCYPSTFSFPGSAPEILGGCKHSTSADIWSLGILIVEMLTQKAPYDDLIESLYGDGDPADEESIFPPQEELFQLVCTNELPTLDEASDELRDFLSKCLCIDASKRASAKSLLEHKFLEKAGAIECLVSPVATAYKGYGLNNPLE